MRRYRNFFHWLFFMPKPPIAAYVWALAVSGAVVTLKLYVPDIGGETPFLLGSMAVFLATFFGGQGPGILATLVTAISLIWFFSPPTMSLLIYETSDRIQMVFYLFQGYIISWLVGKFREIQIDLDNMNTNLERLIEKRTRTVLKVNEELEKSNRELQDFAYVASHDLQEPLRKIQSFGSLLQVELGEDISHDAGLYLERIISSTERMRGLIDDLLTYSRLTTRAKPFGLVDLNEVMEEVLEVYELRIKELKAKVRVDSLPKVRGDRTQILLLMQNLFSNGLKFHKKGRRPAIHLYEGERINGKVVWIVEDKGIGISEEYYDRIFAMFERLHGRQNYPGTGIGLSIVKKIVDRHGGEIEVQSKVGKGTRFVVSFPDRAQRGGLE